VQIIVVNGNSFGIDDLGIWIDWNQNGSFYDIGDNIVCEIDDGGQGTFLFDVPVDAVPGTTIMRVRIKYLNSDCGDPCGTATYGEVEDYSINVIEAADPPEADFEADNTNPYLATTVNFTDLSTNNPDIWLWSFDPSTVTYTGGTNSGSQNPQVEFDLAGYYTVELTATNVSGSDTETKVDYILAENPIIDLDITVFLEGPFNGINMNSDINTQLPLLQPYNVSPWNYSGTESVAMIPNSDVVDWLLIELRDASDAASATAATMIDRKAAFLLNSGKIVDLDGSSVLQFDNNISQQLYVVIWHRNHLGIMSYNYITESDGAYVYNFTTGMDQVFGSLSGHKEITPGKWGMMGGDGNHDGFVTTLDKSPLWENEAGNKGYLESDYNLDEQSNNKDKDDIWTPNEGKGSQVPN